MEMAMVSSPSNSVMGKPREKMFSEGAVRLSTPKVRLTISMATTAGRVRIRAAPMLQPNRPMTPFRSSA
ncbi:hypothetical protein D3C84_1071280 [compost metagenome]